MSTSALVSELDRRDQPVRKRRTYMAPSKANGTRDQPGTGIDDRDSLFGSEHDFTDQHESFALTNLDTEPLLPSSGSRDDLQFEQEVEIIKVPVHGSVEDQASVSIALQVFFPYLVAGVGMVGAGLVLDRVQHWQVFVEVSEMFILVPALLGLKGNLEMTLASRFSTQANLGRLDKRADMFKHIAGNLALVQAQAAVVAFLASAFALTLGWVPKGQFNFAHALLLCASAMTTAALASFILAIIMIAVIIASRRLSINPDNVATPIAASLGDLTTLVILAGIGTLLVEARDSTGHMAWLAPLIITGFTLLTPLWVWIAYRNPHTRHVVLHGWTPVIMAMLISSAGGFILDIAVARYHGIAVFQPVINGVGGNLVAVQASRISTWLHAAGVGFGRLPPGAQNPCCFNPIGIFCGSNVHSRAVRVLLALVVPGHALFLLLIYTVRAGHTEISPQFTLLYLAAALAQVAILLYVCHIMVHRMWMNSVDPDNSAIPYLTALGDLFGTGLLAAVFCLLEQVVKKPV